MSDETARLKLAQLVSLQELNAVTWNEALAQLDALVDLCLKGRFVDAPPSAPADGDAYLVGGAPTGAWSGYAYKIAACLDGGWRFYTPYNGLKAWCAADKTLLVYCDGLWSDAAGTLTGPLVLGGGQIAFSANHYPSADANTLDDYEEGTWTPQLTATATPPTGQTVTSFTASYVKVGRLVDVWFNFNGITPGTGSHGFARITGLPFTPREAVTRGGIVLATNVALDPGYTFMQCTVVDGPYVNIIESGSGIPGTAIPYANILAGANLRCHVCYEAE
jgi:hypothetical protein